MTTFHPDRREIPRDTDDGRDTAADQYVRGLSAAILDARFVWARETLSGIRDTIERTGRVTRPQRQAIRNILRGLR